MISRYLFLSLYQARGSGLGLSTLGPLSPTSALRISAASISISASQLEKQTRRSHCRPPNQALHFNKTRIFQSEMYALLCAFESFSLFRAGIPSRKASSQSLACSGCCSILSAVLASSVPSVLLTVTVSLWSECLACWMCSANVC